MSKWYSSHTACAWSLVKLGSSQGNIFGSVITPEAANAADWLLRLGVKVCVGTIFSVLIGATSSFVSAVFGLLINVCKKSSWSSWKFPVL